MQKDRHKGGLSCRISTRTVPADAWWVGYTAVSGIIGL